MTSTPFVTLLGTGTMGSGMARNLARAGLAVRAWNRSPQRAAPLADDGVEVIGDLRAAVDGAAVVVTMLYDADSVAATIREAAPAPGTVWIQTSTVGIEGTQRLAALADDLGLRFVDAPVLGTKKPAEDGTLVVLASGPDDVHDLCAPVLDAIGSRTMWVGPAGAGSRLKLAANAWVLNVVQGVAESVALTQALGLDPKLFLAAVGGGAMDSPYVQIKGASMIAGDYATSFALSAAAKDAALVLAAAESVGVDAALVRAGLARFETAIAAGHGDEDLSAVHRVVGG
jgi:3-hydroxyisobutyrate dehydrogenase